MAEEIEVKLKYINKEEIKAKLKEIGAKFEEEYDLHDTYFSKEQKSLGEVEEFLRIRKKGDKQELTYKGKKEEDKGIWKREEINVPIGNAENLIKILKCLGLNKIKENKSTRECWKLEEVEIMIINITFPAELNFIEIEAKDIQEIRKVVDLLGSLVEILPEEEFKKLD